MCFIVIIILLEKSSPTCWCSIVHSRRVFVRCCAWSLGFSFCINMIQWACAEESILNSSSGEWCRIDVPRLSATLPSTVMNGHLASPIDSVFLNFFILLTSLLKNLNQYPRQILYGIFEQWPPNYYFFLKYFSTMKTCCCSACDAPFNYQLSHFFGCSNGNKFKSCMSFGTPFIS